MGCLLVGVGLCESVLGWIVVPTKIISYNVRGLGGFEERSEVRRLVEDKKPFVLCLQESKLSMVDDAEINTISGSS